MPPAREEAAPRARRARAGASGGQRAPLPQHRSGNRPGGGHSDAVEALVWSSSCGYEYNVYFPPQLVEGFQGEGYVVRYTSNCILGIPAGYIPEYNKTTRFGGTRVPTQGPGTYPSMKKNNQVWYSGTPEYCHVSRICVKGCILWYPLGMYPSMIKMTRVGTRVPQSNIMCQ